MKSILTTFANVYTRCRTSRLLSSLASKLVNRAQLRHTPVEKESRVVDTLIFHNSCKKRDVHASQQDLVTAMARMQTKPSFQACRIGIVQSIKGVTVVRRHRCIQQ